MSNKYLDRALEKAAEVAVYKLDRKGVRSKKDIERYRRHTDILGKYPAEKLSGILGAAGAMGGRSINRSTKATLAGAAIGSAAGYGSSKYGKNQAEKGRKYLDSGRGKQLVGVYKAELTDGHYKMKKVK